MEWAPNNCGGARFRTLPDYRIQVKDVGIPTVLPGTPLFKQLKQTWKNWNWRIRWVSMRTGVPASYILAIATKETGKWSDDRERQASIKSPSGAQGIMQIMPCPVFQREPFKSLVCESDRSSPTDSLYIGARLLASKLSSKKIHGLPDAASSYNKGDLLCHSGKHAWNVFGWEHEQNYSMVVTQLNNAAIEHLHVNRPIWPWFLVGSATLVAGGAVVYAKQHNRLPRE